MLFPNLDPHHEFDKHHREFDKHFLYEFTFTVAITTSCPPSLPAGISAILLPAADFSDAPSDSRIITLASLALTPSLPHLCDLITDVISSGSFVVALVTNLFSTGAFDVAAEFGLRRYLFFPSTTMCLSLLLHLEELDKTVSCEYADLVEPVNIPGCVPVHGKNLIYSVQVRNNDAYKWVLHHGFCRA